MQSSSATQTRQCSELNADSLAFQMERRPFPPGIAKAEWTEVSSRLRGALADAIRSKHWPIYMFGPAGCGKSSAMACLYRAYKPEARWILLEPFVQQIMKCRQDGRVEVQVPYTGESVWRSETQWFNLVERSPLLCIDDVGLRQPSESAYEVVFKLINARGDRPTIYTSNLDEKALIHLYGKRIESRVLSGTVIECTGEDRRRQRRVRVTA